MSDRQTKEKNSQQHYVLPGPILIFGTYLSMGTKLQLLRRRLVDSMHDDIMIPTILNLLSHFYVRNICTLYSTFSIMNFIYLGAFLRYFKN